MKKPQILGNYTANRKNNFNLLRMLAAIGVLISHAYPISLGLGAEEPLTRFIGMSLGSLSVLIFFSISGFFITKSFVFSVSWQRFLLARALRLFPALFVVLTVTIVLGGVFLTTADPVEFWSSAPGYLLRNLTLFKPDYSLPGVFEANPYGTAINGSLWTLFYEVVCYTGIFIAGLLGILHRPRLFAFCLGLVVVLCLLMPYLPVHSRLNSLSRLALPFAIGSGFFLLRDLIPLSTLVVAILGLMAWGLYSTEAFRPILVLALSYGVFVIGYWPSAFLQGYNHLGDYSYGTYIYAFPVQQLVANWGITDPLTNIAIALPVTLVCAVLSWHFVELVALNLKTRSFVFSARQAHDQ